MRSDAATVTLNGLMTCLDASNQVPRSGVRFVVVLDVVGSNPITHLNRPGFRRGFSRWVQSPDWAGFERSRRLHTRQAELRLWWYAAVRC